MNASRAGEKIALHAHIAIQQHDDVILGRAKTRVGSAAETKITIERQYAYGREVVAQEFRTAVFGPVIHNDDFVVGIAARALR